MNNTANDLETLFLPLRQNLSRIDAAHKILFLNAQYHAALSGFTNLHAQQFFKPYAQTLTQHNIKTVQSFDTLDHDYDAVFILFPKNIIEGKGLIAQALMRIKDGGTILCAADNKAGGTRLAKIFEEFGCADFFSDSKNKARVIWGNARNIPQSMLQPALDALKPQEICDGQFLSVVGVFGWDKIDQGSHILLQSLPPQINGKGADFGCGYGYLSDHILRHHPKVKLLTCADADYRAVDICARNLEGLAPRAKFIWTDLTHPQKELHNLDFIIMNPPFHEGKVTDSTIGISFIRNAAQTLRPGGMLYMVANRHLPYENILAQHFTKNEKVKETNGFKVLHARK